MVVAFLCFRDSLSPRLDLGGLLAYLHGSHKNGGRLDDDLSLKRQYVAGWDHDGVTAMMHMNQGGYVRTLLNNEWDGYQDSH